MTAQRASINRCGNCQNSYISWTQDFLFHNIQLQETYCDQCGAIAVLCEHEGQSSVLFLDGAHLQDPSQTWPRTIDGQLQYLGHSPGASQPLYTYFAQQLLNSALPLYNDNGDLNGKAAGDAVALLFGDAGIATGELFDTYMICPDSGVTLVCQRQREGSDSDAFTNFYTVVGEEDYRSLRLVDVAGVLLHWALCECYYLLALQAKQ